MPQPTSPASVKITQYCPLCQRLLIPMAQPFLNWIGREIVRGSGSFMASPRYCRSGQDLLDHARRPAVDQALFAAVAVVNELRVVQTEQMQDGGLVIVGRDDVDGGLVSDLVGCAIHGAPLDSAAG